MDKRIMTAFTSEDAVDLVTITRRAPLQNMDEAKAVNDLLERFVDFFEAFENGTLFDDTTPGSTD
jgi:hypothetical protein